MAYRDRYEDYENRRGNRYNDRYDDRYNDRYNNPYERYDRYRSDDRYYARRDSLDSREQSLSGYGDYGNYGNRRRRALDRGYGISHAGNDWGYDARDWNAPYGNGSSRQGYYPEEEGRTFAAYRAARGGRNYGGFGHREDAHDLRYGRGGRNRARNDFYNTYGYSRYEGFRNPEADGGYGRYDYDDFYDTYTTMPSTYRSSRRMAIEGLNWNEPNSNYSKYGGGGWL